MPPGRRGCRGVAGAVALGTIVAACGGGGQSPPVVATAVSGALAVTVAGPAGAVAPGGTLILTVSARDAQARGALAYRVAYGDATTDQNAVPQFLSLIHM